MLDKNQEVFERVLNHLGCQKRRAVEGLVCVYKTADGDKCAVGCLIPDEEYKPSFETQPIGTILNEIPSLKDVNLRLLQTLQHLHDSRFFWNWDSYSSNHVFSIAGLKKIQDIANAYNLKIPEAYILAPLKSVPMDDNITSYEIVVVADENDGDYVTKISEITLEEIKQLKPLIEAIGNKDHYNWATFEGECAIPPEKMYPEFKDEISILEKYVHHGEHGVHSIVSVYYYPKPERVVLL